MSLGCGYPVMLMRSHTAADGGVQGAWPATLEQGAAEARGAACRRVCAAARRIDIAAAQKVDCRAGAAARGTRGSSTR
eukprot:5720973-Prymnesium_polylepis.1